MYQLQVAIINQHFQVLKSGTGKVSQKIYAKFEFMRGRGGGQKFRFFVVMLVNFALIINMVTRPLKIKEINAASLRLYLT